MAGIEDLLNFSVMVDAIEGYAQLIFVVLMIYYVIVALKGGDNGGVHKKAWGMVKKAGQTTPGSIVEGFNKFTGREAVRKEKGIKRAAHREKTKVLNEFIEEKKVLGLLEAIFIKINGFKSFISGMATLNTAAEKTEFMAKWNEISQAVVDANTEVKKLNNNTRRQERQGRKLIEKLEDAGESEGKTKAMKVYETKILADHNKIMTLFPTVFANVTAIFNAHISPINPVAVPPALPIGSAAIIAGLDHGNIKGNLLLVIAAQKRAYKDLEQLIVLFRKYWKP